MSLLPKFEKDQITDGSLIKTLSYCFKHCKSDKCKKYYEELSLAKTGFYTCPLGLSSYVYDTNGQKRIFSGFRVKETYLKEKSKFFNDKDIYNPILNTSQAQNIINEDIDLLSNQTKLSEEKFLIDELLHETRKMNGQIKNICDIIWDSSMLCSKTNLPCNDPFLLQLIDHIRHIHIYSYMTFNRFSFYDLMVNPNLEKSRFYNTVIYKKFDKMRLLLKNFDKKNVSIVLHNKSTYAYRVNSSFEALLFIVLQNAVKYSPDRKAIDVYFDESSAQLKVTIISIGPFCKSDEICKLGMKGFRGDNAKATELPGHGLGLNFAYKICEQNKIGILFRSENNHERINRIPYGDFSVELLFEK